ncbi:MAG: hypothetical protein WC858_02505 [Parcubacteria group bacterium]|jgi:hypothetical protein
MSSENKDGDGIHVRAVRYGYERPNGFIYKDIETHYSRREREWEIVKKFLNDAFDNFTRGLNRETPYTLLEQLGNQNADESKYTLSYQAYIQYFEYEELRQAKEDTILAQNLSRKAIIIANKTLWVAYFTLVITLAALLYSIYFSTRQVNAPTKIDFEGHHKSFRSFN